MKVKLRFGCMSLLHQLSGVNTGALQSMVFMYKLLVE